MLAKVKKTIENLPGILKGAACFTIVSFLQKGLSVLTTPIFTRVMSVAEYGTYSIYMSWYNIIVVLCTLNLSSGMLNSFLIRNENRRDDTLTGVMGFQAMNTMLLALVYGVFFLIFGPLPGLTGWMGFLIFVEILFTIPETLWLVREKYDNHYRAAFIILAASFMNTVVSLAWVVISQNDKPLAKIYGILIGSFPFMCFYLYTLLSRSKKILNFSVCKMCFFTGGPLIMHYLSQSIMGQSDKLIIQSYCEIEDVAIYSMAHSISWLLYIFVVTSNSTVMPWLYKRMKKNDTAGIHKSITVLMILLCVMSLCVSLLSPELMLVFGGKKYVSGANMIPPLVCALIYIFVTTVFTNFEFYFQKTMVTAVSTILGAVVNITLNYLFIPRFGPVAACYTTLFSYLLIAVIHYFSLKRLMDQSQEFTFRDFISTKTVLFISAAFSVAMLCSPILFEHIVVRLLLMACAGILTCVLAFRWYTSQKLNEAK